MVLLIIAVGYGHDNVIIQLFRSNSAPVALLLYKYTPNLVQKPLFPCKKQEHSFLKDRLSSFSADVHASAFPARPLAFCHTLALHPNGHPDQCPVQRRPDPRHFPSYPSPRLVPSIDPPAAPIYTTGYRRLNRPPRCCRIASPLSRVRRTSDASRPQRQKKTPPMKAG